MKKIFSLMFLLVVVLPVSAQILYRISGNGLQKDSYVVGTYHLADASFVDKIPCAHEVLQSVEQVWGEVPMDVMSNPDSVAVMQQKMMLQGETTIKDLLTAEQFEKVDAFFETTMGMKLSNPFVYGQLSKMSPMALEQTLEVMIYMKKSGGQFDMNNAIDSFFQKEAQRMGKPVGGFETLSFQSSILFDRPLEEQVKGLICLVDNAEFITLQAEELTEAYYSQNIEKIKDITNEKVGNDCDDDEEIENITIYNRNDNWIRQMPAIMSEHSTLFAVGAAHLINDRGLIAQLRSLGYTVEGVK